MKIKDHERIVNEQISSLVAKHSEEVTKMVEHYQKEIESAEKAIKVTLVEEATKQEEAH